jgi:hypothetical protein
MPRKPQVPLTCIELTVGIGSGWPYTARAWALCQPEEVVLPKKLPTDVTIKAYKWPTRYTKGVYQNAVQNSKNGGYIDWSNNCYSLHNQVQYFFEAKKCGWIPVDPSFLINEDAE